MPRGIPNKKPAKKTAVKRKYARRVSVKQQPDIAQDAEVEKTTKHEIIEHLEAYGVQYTDMDGHIAILESQMISSIVLLDMSDIGIQAINARVKSDGTPYIAVYY
jgi:hypothetical protein